MFFALDKNKNRVIINEAISGCDYFCQLCGNKMTIKRGSIKAHHFAHQAATACDGWNHDMSEWHTNWQSLFPPENREVVLIKDGKKHIADVLIDKTVIEFQHSPLSPEEFDDRNEFYTSLGYKVIWIFDLNEESKDGRIEELEKKEFVYRWKHPKQTFINLDLKNDNVLLFFELGLTDEGYDTETKFIARVVWRADKGFEWFAIDSEKIYSEQDFIEIGMPRIKKLTINDLIMDMYEEHQVARKGHAHIFNGCPISKTGYAASNDIDYLSKQGYGICEGCIHYVDYYKCKYLLDNLNLPTDVKLLDLKKDNNGFIKSISYLSNGNYYTKEIESIKPTRSTIIILWNNLANPSSAIFYDTKNDIYVRINRNPSEQYKKYRKIYGVFSKNRDSFISASREVYFFDEPRWKCARWFKK